MRKVSAIFLLAITLYNAGGYMVAFQYFISRANSFNELEISNDRYKETDLVEIKIPVHLAGVDNWRGYERVSGSVQLAQNSYNYVRMKMTTDTIYVMCIPNYKTTRLIKDNVICAREVSEAPFNAKKQTAQIKNVKIAEYISTQEVKLDTPQCEATSSPFYPANTDVVNRIPGVASQPPEPLLS